MTAAVLTTEQAQIVALHRYLDGPTDFVSENWASRSFASFFRAAVELCRDELDNSGSVDVNWRLLNPTVVNVFRRTILSERTNFHRELPLEGDLAKALLSDYTALAAAKARKDIINERERALDAEAALRVAGIIAEA